MISADAKCKVSVGEPDYPIAAVSRGKAVIVGKNETFKVGDHDYSLLSLIPDAILLHSIPEKNDEEEEDENTECNKQSVGKWYSGKVFYSLSLLAYTYTPMVAVIGKTLTSEKNVSVTKHLRKRLWSP